MSAPQQNQGTGKRLSRIVPIYFVLLLIFLTTTLLYWTYLSSNDFITGQLKNTLSQRQINAEYSLNNIFEKIAFTVQTIAVDTALTEAVATVDLDLTLEVLRRNLNSQVKNELDILFVKDLQNKILVDDSSPFFDLQPILPVIAVNDFNNSNPSQLFTFSAEQSHLVIVGKSFPLIHLNTGRVVGTLFGGTVLNDDITMVENMRSNIKADSLMILQEGRIIASTRHADTPIIVKALGHQPVASDDFRRLGDGYVAHYQKLNIHTKPSSLELVFIIKENIFADIKTSYQNTLILLIVVVIGFTALTFYFVRWLIIYPLNNLSSYATLVGKGIHADYQNCPVAEYNQIGIVMTETVAGLQQTTVQLQDEIVKRQEVMDQLRLHRNSLEQIVEMRTKELRTTNENLTARNLELDREKIERMQAQAESRQLAEAVKNSPVSILITDAIGRIEYVNPKFSELTQYSPEEAIGKNPRILNAGVLKKEYFKKMWTTILAGNPWYGEFCNKKKDGEIFWELASISPICNEDGKIKHFVGVKEDITARKLTETNLEQARQKAEEASQQKSLFLANISHEIRTPMNALIGLSELALESELNNQQQDYLNKINSSAHSLLNVLNDILDYSRIESGKMKLNENTFFLVQILEEINALFIDQAQQKNLELQLNIEDDIPPYLLGDSSHLRQVLINLVDNGLKFTDKGSVKLTVSQVCQTKKISRLKFSIIDSGIGIPTDKLDLLFKAFSQVDASHTRKYGGSGLGLAISKELIELMGGQLKVKTREGSGSEFFFLLEYDIVEQDGKTQQIQNNAHKTNNQMDTTSIIDDQSLTSQLIELNTLLKARHFDATSKWLEIKPLFQGQKSEAIKKIDGSISRFEFDQAIKHLAAISAGMEDPS